MEPAGNLPVIHSAWEVPEILSPNSPLGLRVMQIAADDNVPTSHVYMEAHVFTPDSRRFIFQRLPAGTDYPRHYCVCDLDDNYAIRQITDEPTAAGAAVSPDGKWMYYHVNQLLPGQPGTTLKRVSLENFQCETLLVMDKPLSGAASIPTLFYFLSSISRDGARICTSAFGGDGQTSDAPWILRLLWPDWRRPGIPCADYVGKTSRQFTSIP